MFQNWYSCHRLMWANKASMFLLLLQSQACQQSREAQASRLCSVVGSVQDIRHQQQSTIHGKTGSQGRISHYCFSHKTSEKRRREGGQQCGGFE